MKKENKNIYVDEDAYNIALEILKFETKEIKNNKEISNEIIKSQNLDYSKWEEMSKHIQIEEIITNPFTKQVLKLENKNDIRKMRLPFEKPSISKFEACLVFKNFGDYLLTESKQFIFAEKVYDIALSFLFITKFNDDEEETKKQKELRNLIHMNLAFSYIQQEKHLKALEFLNESFNYDKKNLKTIYRISHIHFKLNELEKAQFFCDKGLEIESINQEFNQLKLMIKDKILQDENKAKKLFKKIIS